MNQVDKFRQECKERVRNNPENRPLADAAAHFMRESIHSKYSYNFEWMGRPIIQYPQDMIAMQEIIWRVKPDLIIETGVAHGGSIIYYASLLELIGRGEVVGIDIDIRAHNRAEIEKHPMFKRITLIEGPSTSASVLDEVRALAGGLNTVMVCLDSNHTHDHVRAELKLYSEFVTKDSYLVVFDTIIESLPDHCFNDRPWKKGNSPWTAVEEFLKLNSAYVLDSDVENKLLLTVAPGGYLKRVS